MGTPRTPTHPASERVCSSTRRSGPASLRTLASWLKVAGDGQKPAVDPTHHLPKPVPLRISGSVALVAKPEGASHTAGTALSTCIPVATLAAWACSAMLALPGEAGQRQEVHAHGRVALDGQRPAVLGRGPMLRVFAADGPQRLDLDARFAVAPPDHVPALARRRARPQQPIEDLVVLLAREWLRCRR